MWNGFMCMRWRWLRRALALPRILEIEALPGLALDLDAAARRNRTRRRESSTMPAGGFATRPASRRSSRSAAATACHCIRQRLQRNLAAAPSSARETRRVLRPVAPRSTASNGAEAAASSVSDSIAWPSAMRGCSAHAVPDIEVAARLHDAARRAARRRRRTRCD